MPRSQVLICPQGGQYQHRCLSQPASVMPRTLAETPCTRSLPWVRFTELPFTFSGTSLTPFQLFNISQASCNPLSPLLPGRLWEGVTLRSSLLSALRCAVGEESWSLPTVTADAWCITRHANPSQATCGTTGTREPQGRSCTSPAVLPRGFPPILDTHSFLRVTPSLHVSYPFPLPFQLIWTLCFILTACAFPIPRSPGEAGMSSADTRGRAVAMAAVKCFKRDLKHPLHSGGSGPPSSWLGLKVWEMGPFQSVKYTVLWCSQNT